MDMCPERWAREFTQTVCKPSTISLFFLKEGSIEGLETDAYLTGMIYATFVELGSFLLNVRSVGMVAWSA